MSVERIVFYSFCCDKCHSLLEDYTGELARATKKRSVAENIARENGFAQISHRKWLCPECAKKI